LKYLLIILLLNCSLFFSKTLKCNNCSFSLQNKNFSSLVLFDSNSSKINNKDILKDIIPSFFNNKNIKNIILTCYTDKKGSYKYNLKLSLDRCISVKKYLSEQLGFNENIFTLKPRGESNIISNINKFNRRVDIKFIIND
jgi:outer membrane protein OmpA-like peptidoglycan-associated protein